MAERKPKPLIRTIRVGGEEGKEEAYYVSGPVAVTRDFHNNIYYLLHTPTGTGLPSGPYNAWGVRTLKRARIIADFWAARLPAAGIFGKRLSFSEDELQVIRTVLADIYRQNDW